MGILQGNDVLIGKNVFVSSLTLGSPSLTPTYIEEIYNPVSNWILSMGVWNDNGIWIDESSWQD